jgi:hypothetical protein
MKPFDSETLDRFDRGEVDYLDAITAIFDSGPLNLFPGAVGEFTWDDAALGELTFYGAAALLSIELQPSKAGPEATPIRVRFSETYVPAGSDVPVNVFDDGIRATIDEEEWQWREVLLHVFWRATDGSILYREQVARRLIDAMPVEIDEDGRPVRVAVLEQPAIVQRDTEGKTHNAELQKLIDPTDLAFEHVGKTATQKFVLGSMPEQKAK